MKYECETCKLKDNECNVGNLKCSVEMDTFVEADEREDLNAKVQAFKEIIEKGYVLITRKLYLKISEEARLHRANSSGKTNVYCKNSVLWNDNMDYCVGLKTDMSLDDFIIEAKKSHISLTGERLADKDFDTFSLDGESVWRLIVNI